MLQQKQSTVSSLIGGISNRYGGPLSPSFLYQVIDAKAVTPKVVNSYLEKAEQVLADTEGSGSPGRTDKKATRDLITEFRKQSNSGKSSTQADNTSQTPEPTPPAPHYGIVGEIIDKYA